MFEQQKTPTAPNVLKRAETPKVSRWKEPEPGSGNKDMNTSEFDSMHFIQSTQNESQF